ncbi:ribosomal large subunit pseudouridine synthase E [Spirosomataceae bacterium TFI 002]|nr:ribosomal large subunit pseudouridine synthase E [Spirosomataceae bacterium TFI 002]
MNNYYLINKPYGMLSQFIPEGGHRALCDFGFDFPKDVYPVGRLDHDSEGLLLITNDNKLKNHLLDPKFKQPKTYWAQVEGEITDEALRVLKKGVEIKHKGKVHKTAPCDGKLLGEIDLPERDPPIRYRKSIPTSWVELTITEGKNRQVRKMTAAVGFPTLRLIRVSIGDLTSQLLENAEIRTFGQKEIYGILNFRS